MKNLICVCGVTCSGKDSLCEYASSQGDGIIQVGKEMRLRHPPEYFNGYGAMESTEKEAWDIFNQQYLECMDRERIFVSGQPRTLNQVSMINDFVLSEGLQLNFVYLYCSNEELGRRASNRWFKKDEMDLFRKRVINDRVQCYDAIMRIVNVNSTFALLSSYDTENIATEEIYNDILITLLS